MKPSDMNNKNQGNNISGNSKSVTGNMPADKTSVNNLKKSEIKSATDSCPVDQTKGMSYLPPKDENTL